MRTFVVKLAAWHRLFKELEHARLRLAQAEAAQPRNARAGEIQEDVRSLQRACDHALRDLQTAADAYMAAVRQQSGSTPIEKRSLGSSRLDRDLGLTPAQSFSLG